MTDETTTEDKPKRGRRPASRADEVRQERRKKPGGTVLYGQKLSVPEQELDRSTYEYRFANDTGNRVAQLKAEDWDPAPFEGRSTETRHVGTDSGKPVKGLLMRKRKDWYAADQKEKGKAAEELDKQIQRGTAHQKNGLSGEEFYTPDAGNSIKTPSGVSIRD